MSGRLRLTGGTLGRRLIDVPAAADKGALRPTSDKVREALCSILNSRMDFVDAVVVDVCCGSGALGFEALSRGASRCTFVDADRKTMTVVQRNADSLGVSDRSRFVVDTVARYVGGAHGDADLVFFDPPYAMGLDATVRAGLSSTLAPGGILVVERSAKSTDPAFEGLLLVDERRYGDTRLVIMQRPAEPESVEQQ